MYMEDASMQVTITCLNQPTSHTDCHNSPTSSVWMGVSGGMSKVDVNAPTA